MTLADYYTPGRVGQLYAPDVNSATAAGAAAGLRLSQDDTHKVYLLLVDVQVDFVHEDGALSVPGAVDDTRRLVEWMYQHIGEITTIGASLDSHLPVQIFHPAWWVDAEGNHPAPFTAISNEDVHSGVWRALVMPEWSTHYTELLEEEAKKVLMVWPYHVLIGTPGHGLVPAVYEAIAYHTVARKSQPTLLTKGTIPQTEHYSIMEPEVKVDLPGGGVNTAFMDTLAEYDLIYIAGQAKSHCVLETVTSMMRYYPPEVIKKLRILSDTMSSVAHPEMDFDALADETFARFQANGLTLTDTEADIG
jgi:nicotinamidase/pyrazinamidase